VPAAIVTRRSRRRARPGPSPVPKALWSIGSSPRSRERTQPRMAQRVIFVSGNSGEPRYQRFLAGLEDRNLTKPFDIGQLTRLIRARLDPATE